MTDFRFGNERVVDAAGFGIHVPRVRFGPPAPHRHHWLIRPEDLLVFDVGWVNLKLEPGEGEAPAHLVPEWAPARRSSSSPCRRST